ncbi:hypothetical protein RLEG3_20450 [Rhizobium leguminosarum bv. trifolii WSM1689]|nr:hypothetical protein RLEG3_20450 [Rhizobium leguminosarum bv. trifolii WSM1689]
MIETGVSIINLCRSTEPIFFGPLLIKDAVSRLFV